MALLAGRVSAATVSASFAEALAGADNAASNGWRLATAEEAGANDEALPALGEEEPMRAEGDRWVSADGAAQVRVENGRVVAIPGAGAGRHVVASYTVPAGAAGCYAIRDSVLRPAEGAGNPLHPRAQPGGQFLNPGLLAGAAGDVVIAAIEGDGDGRHGGILPN